MTVLSITAATAGAAAVLNVWLAARVGSLRKQLKIPFGDGGNQALTARMRAHSNFIENAPLFLILLGVVELADGSSTWLWVVAALFVAARVLHPFGMDRPPGPLRLVGIVVTWLCLLGLAIYAITLTYRHGSGRETITYAALAQPRASALSPTNGFVLRS